VKGPAIVERAFEIPEGFARQQPVSGFGRHVGPFFLKTNDDGSTVRAFRVREEHLNSAMIVHGGMLASFLDMVLADAVRRGCGRLGFTVRLVTDFHSPAKFGDWVEGRGRLTRATRTLAFVGGELSVGRRRILSGRAVFALSEKDGD